MHCVAQCDSSNNVLVHISCRHLCICQVSSEATTFLITQPYLFQLETANSAFFTRPLLGKEKEERKKSFTFPLKIQQREEMCVYLLLLPSRDSCSKGRQVPQSEKYTAALSALC